MPQTDFNYHVSLQFTNGTPFLGHYTPVAFMDPYPTLRALLAMLSRECDVELSYSKVYRDIAHDQIAAAVVLVPEKLRGVLAGRGDVRVLFLIHRTMRPATYSS